VINILDGVIALPKNLSSTLNAWNLTTEGRLLNDTGYLLPLEFLAQPETLYVKGATLFAPTDEAYNAVNNLTSFTSDQKSLIIRNHVRPIIIYISKVLSAQYPVLQYVNGTVVYSPQFGQTFTTSAGPGEAIIAFQTTASGTVVTCGSSTARIVQADILTLSGVVHLCQARRRTLSVHAPRTIYNAPRNRSSTPSC
jgi:hypothetical protein